MKGVACRYIDPQLGRLRIAVIAPSDIRMWVKQLSFTLAPSTVGVAHRILSGIFKSAVADRRTVLVNRQLINVNGREPFFGPLRSQASVRVVPLPTVVADALRTHLRPYPSTSLVFTNNVGAPLRRSAFRTEWNRALTHAGVPAIRFHELRH